MERVVLLVAMLLLLYSVSGECVMKGIVGVIDRSMQCVSTVCLCLGVTTSTVTEGESIAGEEFTLVCSVLLAGGESVDDLTVEWLNASGSVVESGSGTTQLTHTLNPLLPSHGGEYRCRATLQDMMGPVEEFATVNVIVSGLSGRDCVEQTNGIHALHCSSTS